MQLADIKDLKELRDFVSENEYLYSVSGEKIKYPTRFLKYLTTENLDGFFAVSGYRSINPIEHYGLFDQDGIRDFEEKHVGIKVASEFTRYISPAHDKVQRSGVMLRDEYLIPLIAKNPDKPLIVDMDGLDYVYRSVADDIFNGLTKIVGKGVREKIKIVCHDKRILDVLPWKENVVSTSFFGGVYVYKL